MSTTTPNMSLQVPQVNDPSPGYVNNIASSLQSLDAHDHSSGNGAPITQSGIMFTGPFSANGQSIRDVNGLRLQNIAQLPGPADGGLFYMYQGDLYFVTPSLTGIRITANGRVSGVIGGDYNNYSQAAINYIHSQLAYSFVNGVGTSARGLFGGVQLRDNASGNVVNLGWDPNTGLSVTDASGNYLNINLASVLRLASSYIQYDATNTQFNFKDATNTLCKLNCGAVNATGNAVFGGGAQFGGSAQISGNAGVTGALNVGAASSFTNSLTVGGNVAAVGGVTQGSRSLALRSFVSAASLSGTTSNFTTNYLPGSTAGFGQMTFVAPYAGSVASLSARTYGATGTAGSLTVVTTGLNTNATTSSFGFSAVNTGAYQNYTPGLYQFSAGSTFGLTVNTNGWTQGSGNTGVDVCLWVYS